MTGTGQSNSAFNCFCILSRKEYVPRLFRPVTATKMFSAVVTYQYNKVLPVSFHSINELLQHPFANKPEQFVLVIVTMESQFRKQGIFEFVPFDVAS